MLPIPYLSKYTFNSAQIASIKAIYSALIPGTLDGLGVFTTFGSSIWIPLPRYFLIKFIYSIRVIYPSLLVSTIWNTWVRRSFSGLNLRKNVLSLTSVINCWRLNLKPWVSDENFLLMTISMKKIYKIMATNYSKVANLSLLDSNLK